MSEQQDKKLVDHSHEEGTMHKRIQTFDVQDHQKTKEETTNTNGETRTTELEFSNPVELEFLNPVANTCHTISRPINKATIGSP